MDLTIALYFPLFDENFGNSMTENGQMVEITRLNQGIERAHILIESWVLTHSGTILFNQGNNANFQIDESQLPNLPDLISRIQEDTEKNVSCGIGDNIQEALHALKVAYDQGGAPSVVRYDEPPKPPEQSESKDSIVPASDESSPLNKNESNENIASLLQSVGETLLEIQGQIPTLEGLKEEKPEAYDAIHTMIQALVTLAQQLSAPDKETTEDKNSSEFQIGIETESKEHPEFNQDVIHQLVRDHLKENPDYYSKEELSKKITLPKTNVVAPRKKNLRLPVGSVKNRRIKIVGADGTERWVQIAAGAILNNQGEITAAKK